MHTARADEPIEFPTGSAARASVDALRAGQNDAGRPESALDHRLRYEAAGQRRSVSALPQDPNEVWLRDGVFVWGDTYTVHEWLKCPVEYGGEGCTGAKAV